MSCQIVEDHFHSCGFNCSQDEQRCSSSPFLSCAWAAGASTLGLFSLRLWIQNPLPLILVRCLPRQWWRQVVKSSLFRLSKWKLILPSLQGRNFTINFYFCRLFWPVTSAMAQQSRSYRSKTFNSLLKSLNVEPNLMNETQVQRCVTCVKSKMSRHYFRSRVGYRAGSLGELIHSDFCSYEVSSMEGFQYFVTFIDDYSKFTVIYPMKFKSDVFACFEAFRAKCELHLFGTIKKFCTDGGGEYLSGEFRSYLAKVGILHHPGLPHSPQIKGVAKRTNWTIWNHVCCSLSSSGIPKTYWVDAFCFLAHSLNSIPCHAPLGFSSPSSLTSVNPAALSQAVILLDVRSTLKSLKIIVKNLILKGVVG